MTNLKENNQKINLYEQYIKCAIQNGLIEKMLGEPYEKLIDLDVSEHQVYFHGIIKNGHTFTDTYDIIRLITSKEFLKAVAEGLWNTAPYGKSKGTRVKMLINGEILLYDEWEYLYDDLTVAQAFAIRDDELDNFIKNILNIK